MFWSDTLSEDLQDIKMTRSDFREKVADERSLWKSCVAQYASARGLTKV